jgi:hypothetical protein
MRPIIFIITMLAAFTPLRVMAETADNFGRCALIEDDDARLKCYDNASGRPAKASGTDASSGPLPAAAIPEKDPQIAPKLKGEPDPTGASVLARQWDLDETNRARKFVIRTHRSNYILPVAYNTSPNADSNLDLDPNAKPQ